MATAKIIEKNFWARELASVVCNTQMFEEFIKNFPDDLIKKHVLSAVARKTKALFRKKE